MKIGGLFVPNHMFMCRVTITENLEVKDNKGNIVQRRYRVQWLEWDK